MRFQDPMECTCNNCGATFLTAVRMLLQLGAVCPKCGASLSDVGQEMIKTCDSVLAGQIVAAILARLEDELGQPYPEHVYADLLDSEDITILSLCEIAGPISERLSLQERVALVTSVIKALWPSLHDVPELHEPLLKALPIPPQYWEAYR